MTADALSLADLVGDVDAFADHHWGRRPLVRASGLDFGDLLDVENAEALLLTSARRPTFRLVQDGERLPPERSTTPVRMGGATLDDVADVAKIAEAIGGGATLVLQALQRTWPPLIDFCRRLERELSHPVQANAYLTPAGARGLARHADEHDVLVLQSSGHKSWDVAGLGAITAAPGDVLYLPAHTEHSAEAQGEVSLHITIGILRVTYGHVLRRLLDRLDGVDLDAPLPVGFAAPDRSDALHDELTRQLREVAAAVARIDAGDVVQHEQRRATRWRSPLPRGQLQSILALDRIDASTVVVARADHPAELVDVDGGRVALCSSIARWRRRRRHERRSSTCFAARTRRWASSPASATPAARSSYGASSGKAGSASSIPDRPAALLCSPDGPEPAQPDRHVRRRDRHLPRPEPHRHDGHDRPERPAPPGGHVVRPDRREALLRDEGQEPEGREPSARPRIVCSVEAGLSYDQLRGVSIEGTATIIEDTDDDEYWAAGISVFERYQGEYSDETRPFVEMMMNKRVVVRVDPTRVRSWDHRKLDQGEMPIAGSTAQYL